MKNLNNVFLAKRSPICFSILKQENRTAKHFCIYNNNTRSESLIILRYVVKLIRKEKKKRKLLCMYNRLTAFTSLQLLFWPRKYSLPRSLLRRFLNSYIELESICIHSLYNCHVFMSSFVFESVITWRLLCL